jgi:hypothetical protein
VARGFSEDGHVFEVGEQPGLFVDGVCDESVGAAVGAVEEAAVGVDLDFDGAGAFGSGLRGHVSTSHWLGSGGSAGGPGVSELPAGWRGIDANWKLRPDPVGGSGSARAGREWPQPGSRAAAPVPPSGQKQRVHRAKATPSPRRVPRADGCAGVETDRWRHCVPLLTETPGRWERVRVRAPATRVRRFPAPDRRGRAASETASADRRAAPVRRAGCFRKINGPVQSGASGRCRRKDGT